MALSGAMVSVPTIRRRRLGAALRRLCEASGMSLEAVAGELGWSAAAYRHAHDQLRAAALSPSESRQMISGLLRELMR